MTNRERLDTAQFILGMMILAAFWMWLVFA